MSRGAISRPSAYIMSFTVSAWTNWPGRLNRARRRSAGPSMSVPSGIATFESMGSLACQSTSRHCPVTVKRSSGSPWGSITPAHVAGRIFAMLLEHRAHGLRLRARRRAQIRLHIRRRRRWRRAAELVENPGAAHHRRSPVAIGRVQQHGALAEKAIAILVLKMDAAELRAGHRFDAVVSGQPFIDEGIVGR